MVDWRLGRRNINHYNSVQVVIFAELAYVFSQLAGHFGLRYARTAWEIPDPDPRISVFQLRVDCLHQMLWQHPGANQEFRAFGNRYFADIVPANYKVGESRKRNS